MQECNIDKVREYIKLQQDLILDFLSNYSTSKDLVWLLDFPKSGTINTGYSSWNFTKHGIGLRFIRNGIAPNLVVDVHRSFDNPRCIDLWRLIQYFHSCGCNVSDNYVESLINEMCVSGELVDQGNGLYLYIK